TARSRHRARVPNNGFLTALATRASSRSGLNMAVPSRDGARRAREARPRERQETCARATAPVPHAPDQRVGRDRKNVPSTPPPRARHPPRARPPPQSWFGRAPSVDGATLVTFEPGEVAPSHRSGETSVGTRAIRRWNEG